jgi:hypothetical protein
MDWKKEQPNNSIPLAVVTCNNGNYNQVYLAQYCDKKKVWKEFNSQIPIYHVTQYFIIQYIPRL